MHIVKNEIEMNKIFMLILSVYYCFNIRYPANYGLLQLLDRILVFRLYPVLIIQLILQTFSPNSINSMQNVNIVLNCVCFIN